MSQKGRKRRRRTQEYIATAMAKLTAHALEKSYVPLLFIGVLPNGDLGIATLGLEDQMPDQATVLEAALAAVRREEEEKRAGLERN